MRGVVVVSSMIGMMAMLTTSAQAAIVTTTTTDKPSCTIGQTAVLFEGKWVCMRSEGRLIPGTEAASSIHGTPEFIAYNASSGTFDLYLRSSNTDNGDKYDAWTLAIKDVTSGLSGGATFSYASGDLDGSGVNDYVFGDPDASDKATNAGAVVVFRDPSYKTPVTGDDYDDYILGKTASQKLGANVSWYSSKSASGFIVYDGKLNAKYALVAPWSAETHPTYFTDTGCKAISTSTSTSDPYGLKLP
jgi:hypothetical protein